MGENKQVDIVTEEQVFNLYRDTFKVYENVKGSESSRIYDYYFCNLYNVYPHRIKLYTYSIDHSEEKCGSIILNKGLVDLDSLYTDLCKLVGTEFIMNRSNDIFISKKYPLMIGLEKDANTCTIFQPYYENSNILPLVNNLIKYKEKKFIHSINYVYKGQCGFTTKRLAVKTVCNNLNDNYNNDLPHNRVTQFINSQNSGIGIFYGIPGTGKTTYIRQLISENKDVNFYWVDSKALQHINDESFLTMIMSWKNAVLIMEDCESLLVSRNKQPNPLLATLLNISDGILGDSLNLKFLCTFNADLANIDKALLRKGRLKVKYEFKALAKDKVQKFFEVNGIPLEPREMPLCDMYNIQEENDFSKNNKKKIGFY